jgi:hypothetical protein
LVKNRARIAICLSLQIVEDYGDIGDMLDKDNIPLDLLLD